MTHQLHRRHLEIYIRCDESSTVSWCVPGSPLISRAGWVALLEAQGFHSCVVTGSAAAAPPLLARQSVVVGVSDGIVRLSTAARARPDVATSSTAAAALPLQSVKHTDMMQVCCAA